MREIDLHTHSTASDGSDAPALLVEKAHALGLKAIALTDHDTITGLTEAQEASADLGIELIRGCEISVATDLGNMHMLGLFLPQDSSRLHDFLENLRKNRELRNERIIEKLRACGVAVTLEEVAAIAGETIGRPHFAQILIQKGYASTRDEAFEKWLGPGGKAFSPKSAPTPEEALRILRELGATACLAHPFHKPRPDGWLEAFIERLAPLGLECLEAWHSTHDENQTEEVIRLARKYGLGLSGGSDYHGKNKPDIELGSGRNNNIALPYTVLENLKQLRRTRNLPC
ncbi:MAG: PHP domain-containing protein [Desulfovibrio sp.]|nr:PHP domain-containing protein [Desulfovibrio sp.]